MKDVEKNNEVFKALSLVSRRISEMEAESERLKNENKRLRLCISDDAENARLIMGENAKLRELVKFAYDCATSGVSCRDCDLVFGKGSCQLKSDLENMGIEVDK